MFLQRKGKHTLNAILVDDAGNSYEDAILSVLAPQHSRDSHHAVFIAQYSLCNSCESHSDAVVGGVFGLDDFIGSGSDLLGNLFQILLTDRAVGFFHQLPD